MDESIKTQANQLLNKIDSPILKDQVVRIQQEDPMEELKKEILSFFKNRISSIQRSEHLKELIYNELTAKIQSGELNFDQLMMVLARLDNGANESADSIISMFRPTANGTSTLSEIIKPSEDSSDMAKAFAGYTSEDLQAIEKTMRTIRLMTESQRVEESKQKDAEEPILSDKKEL